MANVVHVSGKPDQVQRISAGQPTTPPQPLYNVVVMVIDDVGTEWFEWMDVMKLSTSPLAYPKTPFLSSVADNGVWFDKATAESICGPTRVTIQTGMLANESGFGSNLRDPADAVGGAAFPVAGYALPASITYLAETIGAARPACARGAFGKWHMADGYSSPQTPDAAHPPDVNLADYVKMGYETQMGNMYNVGGSYTWWKVEDGVAATFHDGTDFTETGYSAGVNVTDASDWLSAQTGQFFAYVAIGPPHSQYTVPPFSMLSEETQDALTAADLEAGDAFLISDTVQATPNMVVQWRASIEAMDNAFGRIWESIPAEQRSRTYLIVTGDNGTVVGGLPAGFLHSKRDLHWGGTRVPFLCMGPGVAQPGRRATQIIHTVDIFRTVCDLMAITVPEGVAPDSVSFAPVLRDTVDRDDRNALREAVYVQQFRPIVDPGDTDWLAPSRQRGVFDGRWRLLNLAGAEQLYDEAADPLEATDLLAGIASARIEAEADRLRALMAAQMPV